MWGIGINWEHVALWRGWLVAYFVLVGIALVVGWRLGPRPDEFAVVVILPLFVLVPYVLACLLLAVLRALWFHGRAAAGRLIGRPVLIAQQRVNR